jgi:hypothetical protein
LRSKLIGAFLALAMVAGVAGTTAIPASAVDSNGIRIAEWEYLDSNGRFGPARPLSEVSGAAGFVGQPTCVGAYDVPSGSWAGTTVCATDNISHPYCNCSSRNGWGGSPWGTSYRQTIDEWWH